MWTVDSIGGGRDCGGLEGVVKIFYLSHCLFHPWRTFEGVPLEPWRGCGFRWRREGLLGLEGVCQHAVMGVALEGRGWVVGGKL